jgi:hypothetical protein
MSGSNALAAAKRRRGGSLPDNRPIQRSVQPQVSDVSQTPVQSVSSVPAPPGWALPANVSPLQIITVHHTELGRMMVEFPETFEELGNSFNSLSANYDNLHGRVVELETNASVEAFKELDAKVKSETDRSFDAMATLKVSTLEMQKNTIENGNRLILINDAIMDFKTRMNAYDALFNDINSKVAMITERFASVSSAISSLEKEVSRLSSMGSISASTTMNETNVELNSTVDQETVTETMDVTNEMEVVAESNETSEAPITSNSTRNSKKNKK